MIGQPLLQRLKNDRFLTIDGDLITTTFGSSIVPTGVIYRNILNDVISILRIMADANLKLDGISIGALTRIIQYHTIYKEGECSYSKAIDMAKFIKQISMLRSRM